MIALLAASAIYLSAFQATIAAPTTAFRDCLRGAATKAKTEKVGAEAIEAYLKGACTAQMSSLSASLIAFRIKNGMTHKAALSDAAMTVDDYIATPTEHYKFMADLDAPKAAPAAIAAPAVAAAKAAAPATAATQASKP